jgi:hypothetical protein
VNIEPWSRHEPLTSTGVQHDVALWPNMSVADSTYSHMAVEHCLLNHKERQQLRQHCALLSYAERYWGKPRENLNTTCVPTSRFTVYEQRASENNLLKSVAIFWDITPYTLYMNRRFGVAQNFKRYLTANCSCNVRQNLVEWLMELCQFPLHPSRPFLLFSG